MRQQRAHAHKQHILTGNYVISTPHRRHMRRIFVLKAINHTSYLLLQYPCLLVEVQQSLLYLRHQRLVVVLYKGRVGK